MIQHLELKRGAARLVVVRFSLEEVVVHLSDDEGQTVLCAVAPLRACALEYRDPPFAGQFVARFGQTLLPLHQGEAAQVAGLLQARWPL
ncbi:MAG: hypothetical protein WCY92_13735 [Novosphingobium sp.]